MSSHGGGKKGGGSSAAGVDNTARRTWDREEYAARAEKREEEAAAAEETALDIKKRKRLERDPLHQGLIVERSTLKGRDYQLDLASRVGKAQVIGLNTPLSQQAGYYCSVCDCVLRDSQSYLDHINGERGGVGQVEGGGCGGWPGWVVVVVAGSGGGRRGWCALALCQALACFADKTPPLNKDAAD